MLKKIAVALLAATVLTAPVLAQGTGAATKPTPPAVSQSTKSPAPVASAPAKAGTAVKAEVKKTKKHARGHKRGGRHAKVGKHSKAGKYLKAATGKSVKAKKSMRHAKRGKHIRTTIRGNASRAAAKPANTSTR